MVEVDLFILDCFVHIYLYTFLFFHFLTCISFIAIFLLLTFKFFNSLMKFQHFSNYCNIISTECKLSTRNSQFNKVAEFLTLNLLYPRPKTTTENTMRSSTTEHKWSKILREVTTHDNSHAFPRRTLPKSWGSTAANFSGSNRHRA